MRRIVTAQTSPLQRPPAQPDEQSRIMQKAKQEGVQITPDGFLVLFHGSRAVPQIKREGSFRVGTYFGTTFDEAQHHGFKPWERGRMYVMQVKVLPEELNPAGFFSAIKPVPVREIKTVSVPMSNYQGVIDTYRGQR